MTKLKKNYTIDEIIDIVKRYSNDDISLIMDSYQYAKDYLSNEKCNESLSVSYLLTSINADCETSMHKFVRPNSNNTVFFYCGTYHKKRIVQNII